MSQGSPATTEITISSGTRYLVQGTAREIEQLILDASRGSLMQFAWLTEVQTGGEVAVNPASVVTLRDAG